jgi:uncharacterized protein YfiM (DUF2279 family)
MSDRLLLALIATITVSALSAPLAGAQVQKINERAHFNLPLDRADVRLVILYDVESLDTLVVRPRPALHDPWFSFDKVQHFTFSFLFTLGGQYTFENKFDLGPAHALPLAVTGSFLVGLGKELYDRQRSPGRYFSYRDLVANGAGIVVAAGFILL